MNKRHYTINSTQEFTNVSFLKNFISPKPFYAHFIFGYRKLQLTSSTCLSVVFLLARWCNAIWLMLFYFSPRVKRLCYLLLQIFTSLLLPSYFLWTTKYSIFFFFLLQYKFFLSFKNFPNSAEPTWGDTCLVWLSFAAIVLCSIFLEALCENTQRIQTSLSSPQKAAQEFDFKTWVWFMAS